MAQLIMTVAARGKLNCIFQQDGVTKKQFQVDPNSPRSRKPLLEYGLDDEKFFLIKEYPHIVEIAEETTDAPATPIYTIRDGLSGNRVVHNGNPFDLIASSTREQLIEWKHEFLGCLDIDYHEGEPPHPLTLESWMESRLRPTPHMWHLTKRGGVHAFFTSVGEVTGYELACAAALHFRTVDKSAKVEIKDGVWGAGGATIRKRESQIIPDTLWLGEEEYDPDSADVQEWLDANNFTIGERYDHDRCPIRPSPDGGTARQPVVILDKGVHCHLCAAHGRGFLSYRTALGQRGVPEVSTMVRESVHWGHAKWVLTRRYGLEDRYAKAAYSAALKIAGTFDPAIFCRDTLNMARVDNGWMNIESGTEYNEARIMSMIATLPAVKNEDGEAIASTVAYLGLPQDLSDRGYSNIQLVNGFALTSVHLPTPDYTVVAMPDIQLRVHKCAPQYIPKGVRKSLSWAEGKLEEVFPKCDWRLIRCLMCAAACGQELRRGMQPIMYVSGTSGTSKSTSGMIASGIIGSGVYDVKYNANDERLFQSVKEGGKQAALVMANEFVKDAARITRRYDPRSALSVLLNINPTTSNHVMYKGSQKMKHVPALILTEPTFPYELKDYTQISRRLFYYKIHGKKNWVDSMAAAGVQSGLVHLFRMCSPELAEAADVILSDVIDEHFSIMTYWDQIAKRLGITTIMDSPEFLDMTPELQRLFLLSMEHPECVEPRVLRMYGKGFRKICRTNTPSGLDKDGIDRYTDLVDCYTTFAAVDDWCRCPILEQDKDWPSLLKTTLPVEFEARTDGASTVYIRWRVGSQTEPTHLNEQIVTPETLDGFRAARDTIR